MRILIRKGELCLEFCYNYTEGHADQLTRELQGKLTVWVKFPFRYPTGADWRMSPADWGIQSANFKLKNRELFCELILLLFVLIEQKSCITSDWNVLRPWTVVLLSSIYIRKVIFFLTVRDLQIGPATERQRLLLVYPL